MEEKGGEAAMQERFVSRPLQALERLGVSSQSFSLIRRGQAVPVNRCLNVLQVPVYFYVCVFYFRAGMQD